MRAKHIKNPVIGLRLFRLPLSALRFLLPRWRPILAVLTCLGLVFLLLLLAVPLPEPLVPPTSRVVRYEDGSIMRAYLAEDETWRIWTPLEDIDPLLIRATLAFEDRYFYFHPGVNGFALARAVVQNLRARRVLSGGSTLTMQLARLLEPKPRTIAGKCQEMFRALQFELRLGKHDILELYLNRAPYGGNYEGVAAASIAYFGKVPQGLSPAEVAYLVSLPQSPTARHPGAGKPLLALAARNRVLTRMHARGLLGATDLERSLSASVPTDIQRFPASAPHAADYVGRRYPHTADVQTTLDRRIQEVAEGFAASHAARLRDLGAHNASIIVMANSTRAIRALVGSLDYWDGSRGGQILGFDIPRSPGSTLKPFLYALALQNGSMTSATLLEDVPADFSGFRPSNFSGTYRGLVTAEFALAHSLNYPFVKLLRDVGHQEFLTLLDRLDLRHDRSRTYGLTVITGGMEVSLLDLTNAYVTLARGGEHAPAVLNHDEPASDRATPCLDPGAVSLTLQALSLRARPDAPPDESLARPKAEVYWKTGTSWGRRDAWSVGSTPDYTVGVWVGNFSNEGSDGIVGAPAAGPVLFDLLAALGSTTQKLPLETDYLAHAGVCALSGLPATEYCPETKSLWVVRDRVPSQRCTFHRVSLVGSETEPKSRLVEHRVATVYPPLAAAIMGIDSSRPLPPGGQATSTQLRIARPTHGMRYVVTCGIRHSGKVPLQAWTDTTDKSIFWFVNDRYLMRNESGETTFLEPAPGEQQIVAVDSAGNRVRARVMIQTDASVW